MQLNGKIALITGANGGLGNAVTTAFLDAGARVIGVSRSIKDSDFAHPAFSAIAAEIADSAGARDLSARAGRVDIFVHLVGGFTGGKPVHETNDTDLERMLDLNLRTAFYLLKAFLPGMREQGSGRVLAIASRAAIEPAAMAGAYSASKAALVSLVQTVARENKDHGITANVLLPGSMDTPANRAGNPGGDFSKFVSPQQVAAMLVHLASDSASNINGAAIPIYGGDL